MPQSLILVVDDDPSNLVAMRQVLEDTYELRFAHNGNQALTIAAQCNPALILLDIQMPGMDGYAVCRALKAEPLTESIPVIFVTGLSDVGHEAAGFEVGAVDYIAKPLSAPIVRARVRLHLSLVRSELLEQSYTDALTMLGNAGHYNDTETGLHIWRMASYSGALAAAVGWSPPARERLEQAAAMHDMGKIGIPSHILRKPGKLDPEEWAAMQAHTRIGYDILRAARAPVFQLAAEIALSHHERWDGSGYPQGLAGSEIPESARIVAVADVFDALTMKRPYKDAWPDQKALAALHEGSGSHFEPRLIERFESIMPELLDIKTGWEAKDPGAA